MDYLHPDRQIQKHGDKLPHWQQDEVMQFVTFRLGDALPKTKVDHWRHNANSGYPPTRNPGMPEPKANTTAASPGK